MEILEELIERSNLLPSFMETLHELNEPVMPEKYIERSNLLPSFMETLHEWFLSEECVSRKKHFLSLYYMEEMHNMINKLLHYYFQESDKNMRKELENFLKKHFIIFVSPKLVDKKTKIFKLGYESEYSNVSFDFSTGFIGVF